MGRFFNDLSLSVDQTGSDAETVATETMGPSISDELSKLKALLDDGVLSAEEFVAAKARLLR
jgi:hypothetical protein